MRHHYTPQNAQPNLVLGTSGPTRVDVGDHDPDFVPRPVGFLAQLDEQDQEAHPSLIEVAEGLGYSVADVSPEQVQQLADISGITFEQAAAACNEMVDALRPAPLLWDGDQA